jgi:hypothetical protein
MRYDGAPLQEDRAAAICIDDTDNVYVTGYSKGAGQDMDMVTVRYSPTGNQDYVLRYNNYPVNLADYANAVAVKNGAIYVVGKSTNGGNDDFETLKYSYAAVGINEPNGQPQLDAFPVPATDQVRIFIGGDHSANVRLEIFNAAGQKISDAPDFTLSQFNNSVSIDVNSLTAGVYFVRVLQNDLYIGTSRIVIQ